MIFNDCLYCFSENASYIGNMQKVEELDAKNDISIQKNGHYKVYKDL